MEKNSKKSANVLPPKIWDYCNYLLNSMKNFTLTNYADHKMTLSHDAINRAVRKADLDSGVLWAQSFW